MIVDPKLEYLEEIATMNAILLKKMEAEALTVSAEQQMLLDKNASLSASIPEEKSVSVKDKEVDRTPDIEKDRGIEKKVIVSKEVEESEDDWEMTPATTSSDKKVLVKEESSQMDNVSTKQNVTKEQSADDWNVTSAMRRTKRSKVRKQSNDDWKVTPAVSKSKRNVTVTIQSDDDWEVTPAVNKSKQNVTVTAQSDDDWEVTPTIHTKSVQSATKERSDDDWKETPSTQPKQNTMSVQSDADWESPFSKLPLATLPKRGRSTRRSKKPLPLPTNNEPASLPALQTRPRGSRRKAKTKPIHSSENSTEKDETPISEGVIKEVDWSAILTSESWGNQEPSSQLQPDVPNNDAFSFFDFSMSVPEPEETVSLSTTTVEQNERVDTILQSLPDLSVFANEVIALDYNDF